MATIKKLLLPGGTDAILAKIQLSFVEADAELNTVQCELRAKSDFDVGLFGDIDGGEIPRRP